MKLAYDAVSVLLTSLSTERRAAISELTERLIRLRLSPDASDAILAAIILEATEVQIMEDGGAKPPQRTSTHELLKPIFESKKSKGKN